MRDRDKKKRRAAKVEIEPQTGKLVIDWQDGHQSRLALRELRQICPCAECQERRRQLAVSQPGKLVILDDRTASATAEARRFELVGRYAIRIVWADGHDYGIYPFEALRALDRTAPP